MSTPAVIIAASSKLSKKALFGWPHQNEFIETVPDFPLFGWGGQS